MAISINFCLFCLKSHRTSLKDQQKFTCKCQWFLFLVFLSFLFWDKINKNLLHNFPSTKLWTWWILCYVYVCHVENTPPVVIETCLCHTLCDHKKLFVDNFFCKLKWKMWKFSCEKMNEKWSKVGRIIFCSHRIRNKNKTAIKKVKNYATK